MEIDRYIFLFSIPVFISLMNELNQWLVNNELDILKLYILQSEEKWALGSITMKKVSGGDGTPVELLQILKHDAVKLLHSICQQIWKTQQGPQDWERSVFIPIPKKGNAKECSNHHTIALISQASKVMLKFSKSGFNSTWTVNFQIFKLDFRKGRGGPEIKLPTSVDHRKIKRVPE